MAITKIPAAGFTGNNFRNIIINGDMSIFQRSTSASSLTGSGYHAPDRYRFSKSGFGTWTWSQSSDVPSGQGFAYSQKLDCTTADASPSAGSQFKIEHKIEGQNLQYLKKGTSSAESLTLSFWVKSNKTGTYIAELFDVDNSRQISKSYTIDSASTWEKKTLTFDGDTSGAFDNDNASSLQLTLWLGAGSTYSSGTLSTTWTTATSADRAEGQVNLADSTSNEWYITGVQLEAGTTASDFEFLPVDVNLQRCLRYYERYNPVATGYHFFLRGQLNEDTLVSSNIFFKQKMRTVPSVSLVSTTSYTANSLSIYEEGFNAYGEATTSTGTSRINEYTADAEL